ncbi:MAG: hypothetical protein ACRYHA_27840 [Janthinobacterium lividum]
MRKQQLRGIVGNALHVTNQVMAAYEQRVNQDAQALELAYVRNSLNRTRPWSNSRRLRANR